MSSTLGISTGRTCEFYQYELALAPFNAFANRADPDQAALELSDQCLLCLLMEICYIVSYTSGPDK